MDDVFTRTEREHARVRQLHRCDVCGKQSDSSVVINTKKEQARLCGTHYDMWLASPERTHYKKRSINALLAEFINRVQAERRNGCSM